MNKFFTDLLKKDTYNSNNPLYRKNIGILSGLVGIFFNLILFLLKFFAGTITSSISITADSFNNLTDATSSIITLVCYKLVNNPANSKHPFGYGRIEYVSGLVISILVIIVGFEFIESSIKKIFSPEQIDFSFISFVIIIISLLIKTCLGIFNLKLSKKINSTTMKVTAMDSFFDAVISITLLIGIIVNVYFKISIDAYLGVLIALFMVYSGIKMIKETLNPLLGQAPNRKFVESINKIALAHKDIIGIHELMVHNYGENKSIISFHAEMPSNINVLTLHDTIEKVEKELQQKFNCKAIIHIDPIVTDDKLINQVREQVSNLVKLIHLEARIYDFRMIYENKKNILIFEVSVPFELNQKDENIILSLKHGIKSINPSYECIVTVNRDCMNDEQNSDK